MGIWLGKKLVLVGCNTEGLVDYEPLTAIVENGFTYNDFSFLVDGQVTTVMVKGGDDYEWVDVRKNGIYLERILVHESSNGDALVDWQPGPKRIWSAERPVWEFETPWTAIGSSIASVTVPILLAAGGSTGRRKRLRIDDIAPVTNDKYLYFRLGYGGGPTIDTGSNYQYGGRWSGPGGGVDHGSGAALDNQGTHVPMMRIVGGSGVSNASGATCSATIELIAETASLKTFKASSEYTRSDGAASGIDFRGQWNSTFDITAIFFGFNGPTNMKNNQGRYCVQVMRD